MTLRARLLLSALILSLAITAVLALVVRDSWQQAEAERFRRELDTTVQTLAGTLDRAGSELAGALAPLCAHDPVVDSALVGLQGGSMDSRLLSIRARIPELKKARGFDELSLVTSQGELLAGDTLEKTAGPEAIRQLVSSLNDNPRYRKDGSPAFIAACIKREREEWVALVAGVLVEPMLRQAGHATNLKLSLHPEGESWDFDSQSLHVEERILPALDGAALRAERSRQSLRDNLQHLNTEVLTASLGTLAGALVLAFFLSRGLARPVVAFAEKTRQAVSGRVEELPVSGGPELEQAARAFNATLADLAALRQRLKATEKIAARREVARQIAHEIKNPLSPIRTSIETLRKLKEREHEEFDSYFQETTATVLEEVRRISALVSNFSEYARLPSPSPSEMDLGALTQDIAQLHEGLGATITVEQQTLPPIRADRDQLSQVLTNLMKNAIEATISQDERRLFVTVSLKENSPYAEVAVHDNGPGLSDTQMEKIFEPYVTTKEDGSGLGLPISQRIAIEHGGNLTYTTSPHGGACFTLSLPINGPPTLAADQS